MGWERGGFATVLIEQCKDDFSWGEVKIKISEKSQIKISRDGAKKSFVNFIFCP